MERSKSGTQNPLDRELAFFELHKSDWLPQYENQFVVVSGDKIAGSYGDYEALGMRAQRNSDIKRIS
jgi:hypothetical protein